jgi:hypothetical protein
MTVRSASAAAASRGREPRRAAVTPWLVLTVLVAGANWAALLAVRGHWGRIALPLALASLAGTAAGDAVGRRTGLELIQIGDFHLVAASVIAQLAMVAVLLVGSLVPSARGGE